MNFWAKFNKPVVGLSPMDGITDAAFRYTIAQTAKPDVTYTEFVNVDGIVKGGNVVFKPFLYDEIERPIVAQLFGIEPEYFFQASQIICELGFDGIDVNMGCPSKTVAGRGAGAGLIRTPNLAKEIIIACKAGVENWVKHGIDDLPEKVQIKVRDFQGQLDLLGNTCVASIPETRDTIPVSLKTRIGYDTNIVEEWIQNLLEVSPAAIALHGRLLKQYYAGKADWEAIARAAKLVAIHNSKISDTSQYIKFLGNGDIGSYQEALSKISQYNLDGVLVGRATFGNPWFFDEKYNNHSSNSEQIKEKLIQHILNYTRINNEHGFVTLRKHMGWYVKGFKGAANLRTNLMQANNYQEAIEILQKYS